MVDRHYSNGFLCEKKKTRKTRPLPSFPIYDNDNYIKNNLVIRFFFFSSYFHLDSSTRQYNYNSYPPPLPRYLRLLFFFLIIYSIVITVGRTGCSRRESVVVPVGRVDRPRRAPSTSAQQRGRPVSFCARARARQWWESKREKRRRWPRAAGKEQGKKKKDTTWTEYYR